jgi:hypothetical protein
MFSTAGEVLGLFFAPFGRPLLALCVTEGLTMSIECEILGLFFEPLGRPRLTTDGLLFVIIGGVFRQTLFFDFSVM